MERIITKLVKMLEALQRVLIADAQVVLAIKIHGSKACCRYDWQNWNGILEQGH